MTSYANDSHTRHHRSTATPTPTFKNSKALRALEWGSGTGEPGPAATPHPACDHWQGSRCLNERADAARSGRAIGGRP